jgi:hypothetical protein
MIYNCSNVTEYERRTPKLALAFEPRLGLASRFFLVRTQVACKKAPSRCHQPPALTALSPTERRAFFYLYFLFHFKVQRAVHKTTLYSGNFSVLYNPL